jgi:hypothetical protein
MVPISAGGHRFLAGARVSAKRPEPHLTSWSGNLTTHRLEEREALGELGGSSAKGSPAAAATVALQKFI